LDVSADGKGSNLLYLGQNRLMDVSSTPSDENFDGRDDNVEDPSDGWNSLSKALGPPTSTHSKMTFPTTNKSSLQNLEDLCTSASPLDDNDRKPLLPISDVGAIDIEQIHNNEKSGTTYSGTTQVNKSPQRKSSSKGTMVFSAALHSVSFSDDVIDAVERSQSDWKMMIEKLSNESEAIKLNLFKNDISVSTIHCSSDRILEQALDDPWEASGLDIEQATENGECGDKGIATTEDEQSDPLPTTQKFSFKEDPVIRNREHNSRRHIRSEGRRVKMTEERKEENDSKSAFEKGVGGMMNVFGMLGRTVSNMTSDTNLPHCACSSNAMYLLDCAKIDLESELHHSMDAENFPLDKSWFSMQESDSISKLTNPHDLSALNSTYNGPLNLSLDLTAIPTIEDNAEDQLYNF
jgi:hypothetical protein